jgi:hypothetical protein
MFYLGTDYVVSSIIWLTIVGIFVFAFRKKIFKRFYQDESLDNFIDKLTIYLKETYPNIKFNLSIIKVSESEPNPDTRKYMIISDIFNQFSTLKLDKSKLPTLTPQSMQWQGYVFNCEPNKNKLPPDWGKRKTALLQRDGKRCIRCSRKLELHSAEVHMIRSLEDGGKYYLENLILVCKDCKKILENDLKKKTGFIIKGELEDIIERS